jgi:hypothetical protein
MIRFVIRAVAAGWLIFWFLWLLGARSTFTETDSQAYWGFDLSSLYAGVHLGDQGAFLYSPVVAQLFAPFSIVPYESFYAVLAVANLGALTYLLGVELAALSIFLVPVSNEIARGNIHLLLAAAIVVSMRWPAAWAAVLLTKVTPGIGVLWFAFRREWRSLAIALGTTVGIAAISFVFVPDLWRAWLTMLVSNTDATRPNAILQVPVLPRLLAAAVLIALGALRDRPAIIPVAAVLALPAIWVNSLSMLVAIVPLWRGGSVMRPAAASHRQPAIGKEAMP